MVAVFQTLNGTSKIKRAKVLVACPHLGLLADAGGFYTELITILIKGLAHKSPFLLSALSAPRERTIPSRRAEAPGPPP